MTRKPGRPRQTQRVRIKLMVNAAGEWAAYGWDSAADGDQDEVLYDIMSGKDVDMVHMVYVTADVPLPQLREYEVRAKVELQRAARAGGLARAAALSADRRSEIARNAAQARWRPRATDENHPRSSMTRSALWRKLST